MKKLFTLLTFLAVFTAFSQSSNHYGHIKLLMNSTNLGEYNYFSDFYFNANATTGLDPGYDAGIFESEPLPYMLYSYLVDNTGYEGLLLAVQALSPEDMEYVVIPLGVNVFANQEVSFSVVETDLDSNIQISIIDVEEELEANITEDSYSFTATEDLSGDGRFYLKFNKVLGFTLSNDNYEILDASLKVNKKFVTIKDAPAGTICNIFSMSGLIMSTTLEGNKTEKVNISNLSNGNYFIELLSGNKRLTHSFVYLLD